MISHGIAFKALRTMREQMAEKMARVPMGTIVDTPTGTFKNRFVDNVNQLEDAIAHFMPELPSTVFAPLLAMIIVFCHQLAYGTCRDCHDPLMPALLSWHDAGL